MSATLGTIDDRLMWEFGPPLRGGKHRLVITPEAERHLRPLVADLLKRAPADLSFELYPGRLAESVAQVEATVEGRTGVSIAGWRACLAPANDFGFEVTFLMPKERSEDAEANAAAFVAAEALLGEEVLDTYVDRVDVSSTPVEGVTPVPLSEVPTRVAALLESLHTRLPALPQLVCSKDHDWTMLQLRPQKQRDYAHQTDLFIAKTSMLPMWQRAHSDAPFMSKRFSAHGETFCFLKFDGSQGLEPTGFPDKATIEDALEQALTAAKLGTFIGGGTGLRYSYVDLALSDVSRAIPVIRKTLREGKIEKRSWLLFYDSEYAAEWAGMWDDTPPPPGLPD